MIHRSQPKPHRCHRGRLCEGKGCSLPGPLSPFLILKCIAERGPALTQSYAWEARKEQRGKMRSGKGFYVVDANPLLPPTVESGMTPSCGTILGSLTGSMWLPLLLATCSRSLPFPLAKVPKILGIFGKCSQPEGVNMINLKSIHYLRAQSLPLIKEHN